MTSVLMGVYAPNNLPALAGKSLNLYLKKEKNMDLHEFIEIKHYIMLGKPVIRGTRIPVELIVRKLGEGATIEELLVDGYPNLTHKGIQAALIYAADIIGNEKYIALKTGTSDCIA